MSVVPKLLVPNTNDHAAGGDTVATVDRPWWEAAVKGAIKVCGWIANPYADLAPTEEQRPARAVMI